MTQASSAAALSRATTVRVAALGLSIGVALIAARHPDPAARADLLIVVGLSTALGQALAGGNAREALRMGSIARAPRAALLGVCRTSAVVVLIGVLGAPLWGALVGARTGPWVGTSLLGLAAARAILRVQGEYLRGLGEYVRGVLVGDGLSPLIMLLILLGAPKEWAPETLIASMAAAGLIASVLVLWVSWGPPSRQRAKTKARQGLKASWAASGTNLVAGQVDTILANNLLPATSASAYLLGARLGLMFSIPLSVIGGVTMEAIVRSTEGPSDLTRYRRLCRGAVGVALAALLVAIFAPTFIVELVPQGALVRQIAIVVALGQIASLAAGTPGLALQLAGHESAVAWVSLGGAAGITGWFLLCPPTPVILAIGPALGATLSNTLLLRIAWLRLGHDYSIVGGVRSIS